ncbi:MAG TPA: hypothetical protein GXX32_08345, partial [Methanothermobacter sp.]|nr:hypothetical protein [Methanothermobacter sp.]
LAKRAKTYYPDGIACGPEIFDAMEKRAKEERKEQKRDKQRIEAALAEMAETAHGQLEPGHIDQVRVRLSELKERRDELLRASGASRDAKARSEALLARLEDVELKIRATREQLRTLAVELEQCGEADNYCADVENELAKRVDALTKSEAAAKGKLEAINKAGAALSGRDRMCPLAPDHLQCCLTAEQLEAVLSTLRQEHKQVSQELRSISQELAQARKELAEETRRREESRAQANKALLIKGRLNTQQAMLDSLIANKKALEQERDNLPHIDVNGDTEKELEHITGLIAAGEKELQQFAEAEALARKKAGLCTDVETLAAEVADLEVLVKALGPDGLRRDMLYGILEGFVSRVNDRLGRLTEGAYKVSLGGDMSILCRANGGPVLPLRLLSRSEQLRVGIAISDALSAAAGLKFLAIDEADVLEQDNRDLLSGMLLELAEEYDQVLVFSTLGNVQPANPGLPGVKMFWLEEGAVKEI